MADVTGQFGNEEVVLNNAATEATLKQLLVAMTAMAKAQGVEVKNAATLDKDLGRLGKQTENADAFPRKNKRQRKMVAWAWTRCSSTTKLPKMWMGGTS